MSEKNIKDDEFLDLNLEEDLNLEDINLDEDLKSLEVSSSEKEEDLDISEENEQINIDAEKLDSNDLDIDADLLGDINLEDKYISDMPTEVAENLEEIKEEKLDFNFDDLNLDDNLLNNDNDKDILDSEDINIENKDIDIKTDDLSLDAEVQNNLDLDIESFDIEKEMKSFSEETTLTDQNITEDELNLENDSNDDLDLKSDLGLDDELSISQDEAEAIEDFNLDLVDDQGSPIDNSSHEEYGVDLKSDPETIDTWFDEMSDSIEAKDVDDLIDTEIYDEMEKDKGVEKIVFPEKKEIDLDKDQEEFLSTDIDNIDFNLESFDKTEKAEIIEDIGAVDTISSDSDNNIDLNEEILTKKEEALDSLEDIESDSIELTNLDEDITAEDLSLDKLDSSEEDTVDDMSLELEEETQEKNVDIDKELGNLSLDEVSLDDITLSEEVLVEDKPISDFSDQGDTINLDETVELESKPDFLTIETSSPEIYTKIEGKEDDNDKKTIEAEDENLDLADLSDIESKLFPTDGAMPELDEEIKKADINLEEETGDSITPLPDADTVLSGAGDINSEDFETETIDLSSFDADLKEEDFSINENNDFTEINQTDEEQILQDIEQRERDLVTDEELEFANLRSQMKNEKADDEISFSKTEKLKEDVKEVLVYLDRLLDALPEDKIKEFAKSEAFEKYKKLFEELKII